MRVSPPDPLALAPMPSLLRGWPAAILVLGLLLTALLHFNEQQDVRALQQAAFESRAGEVSATFNRRLHANAALLNGVAALFTSSEHVTREEFRHYVDGLDLSHDYPGIQGVGFSQWRAPGGSTAASSIVYLEPLDWRNQRAIGYDMFSEPVRQDAMRRATETGKPSLSGRVRLVQENGKDVQHGFLIYVPIYRPNAPLTDSAARWRALEGWAYSPLRAGDLIESLFQGEMPNWQSQFGLSVYASPEARNDTLLYTYPLAHTDGATLQHDLPLSFNGSHWLLRVQGTRAATHVPDAGLNTAATGALVSLLLALLAAAIARGHHRVRLALNATMQANQQLQAQQAELRLAGIVMNASPLGIIVTNREGLLESINPAFTRISRYTADDVLGQSVRMLEAADSGGAPPQAMWDSLKATGKWEGELLHRRKNGEAYPAFISITEVLDPQGRVSQYVALLQDITERRAAENRILQLAHHDYLTGLPNRVLLVDRAAQDLDAAKRYGRHPAILFMDLDRFKPVNDTYGHEAGDAVLIEVARRLTELLRKTDLVCRQGGDEFVILLPDHKSRDGLLRLARKLVATVEAPYFHGEHRIELSGSIGIAVYPEHGRTVDDLIRSADEAMYLAKHEPDVRIHMADTPPSSEAPALEPRLS